MYVIFEHLIEAQRVNVTPKRNTTFKIGITGNICTGKSLVRATLQRYGISTFDPEPVVLQRLIAKPHELSKHFGDEILDGRGHASPKKLMGVLYQNPDKRVLFEEILNPIIREEVKHFLYTSVGAPMRAVEFANLLETDSGHLYDEIWMVTADPEQQIERLSGRGHLSRAEARYHVNSQWAQEKKVEMSHRVIDNSTSIQQTEFQVRKILDELNLQIFKIGL